MIYIFFFFFMYSIYFLSFKLIQMEISADTFKFYHEQDLMRRKKLSKEMNKKPRETDVF